MTPSRKLARRTPPACLAAAMLATAGGRIRSDTRYAGIRIMGLDAQPYTVFRHLILARRTGATADTPILVVRFRFARGTQAVNRLASLLPIPLIVGYPGFREKIWTMNPRTGYWQGIYQWESDSDAANYCRSFVLSIMTRRTEQGSLSCTVVDHSPLADYIAAKTLPPPG